MRDDAVINTNIPEPEPVTVQRPYEFGWIVQAWNTDGDLIGFEMIRDPDGSDNADARAVILDLGQEYIYELTFIRPDSVAEWTLDGPFPLSGPGNQQERPETRCDSCGRRAAEFIGCPDGREVCQSCSDDGIG